MREVIRWESSDGGIFDSKEMCLRHEARNALCSKLDSDLYLRDVSAEDVVKWIEHNFELLTKFIYPDSK